MGETIVKSGNELEKLVTLIIPAYNVEKYIFNCISSIQKQTYKNIEIIIVDDGSTDNTPKILDKIKKNDNRICVIHKKNSGVSAARNTGLDIAKGDYVVFVDGDDYLEIDYVSYFVDLIEKYNCDIAMGKNFFTVWDSLQVKKDDQIIMDSMQVMEEIYLSKIREPVWNKIYKRAFLKKNELFFDPDFWFGEGMLFNIRCLQYTDKVALGFRKLYHQTYNPDSAMRNFNLESNYCGIHSLEEQKKIWKNSTESLQQAWDYHYRCFSLNILRGIIKTNQEKKYKDVYKKCIKNLRKNIDIPLKVNIALGMKVMYLFIAISPILVTRAIVCRDKFANRRAIRLLKQYETLKK